MKTIRWLFGGAVFLASFLLFLVEPIAAKQLLPVFGGSAAVWLTCLVYFQTALLAGYLYAHWMARHPGHAAWVGYLLLLLVAVATSGLWAFRRHAFAFAGAHPVTNIFTALAISIGLPFLILSSTSPLFQVWVARLERGAVPYRLFALSNLASLLALGLYPTLIEPHLTLRTQRIVWCCGFLCFALMVVAASLRMKRTTPDSPELEATLQTEEESISWRAKCLWLLLPMVGAMQLSAITSYLTANIAPIPLLWILPLAAYLLTLVIAFEYARFVPRPVLTRLLAVMLAALAYMLAKADVALPARIAIGFFLAEMFLACLFCHVEAYRLRPRMTKDLTVFYLMFAAGGAIGSFLIGIASPLLFSFNYDVTIAFLATAAVALLVVWPKNWRQRIVWSVGTLLMLYILVLLHAAYQQDTLLAVRNFYASLRVKQSYDPHQWTLRTLSNGTIQHGTQIFTPELSRTPTTYYAEDSGVGMALRECCAGRPRRVGVVGLGAGTIAAYGKAGDQMRFYEINPAVEPIAQHLFTYLRDSPSTISFVDGDARASLAKEAPQRFDVLVVDAFSGDAIPLHLLTTEAVAIYRRHLAAGGILAFHISNQHVDLEPAIYLLAQAAGMQSRTVQSLANDTRGEFNATWVLMTNDAAFLALPEVARHSRPVEQRAGLRVWTDDYSSLLPLLR